MKEGRGGGIWRVGGRSRRGSGRERGEGDIE